jgi:hypothetical protein
MKILCFLFFLLSLNAWSFDHTHQHFDNVLRDHVKKVQKQSLVNYKQLQQRPSELDTYIEELSKVSKSEFESWTRDQKLAALINGYNAWTIKLIINHYPVSSIRKIGPFFSTPWKIKFIKWLGEEVSLDEIEHARIRKEYSEPRIHFALVCASRGCPSLQKIPFLHSQLDSQLDRAMNEFLLDESENRYVIKGNEVQLSLSSIFKWYGSDFGSEDDLKKIIIKGMGIDKESKGKKFELNYLDYDWSLNDAK